MMSAMRSDHFCGSPYGVVRVPWQDLSMVSEKTGMVHVECTCMPSESEYFWSILCSVEVSRLRRSSRGEGAGVSYRSV